jgi:hypothetical protein
MRHCLLSTIQPPAPPPLSELVGISSESELVEGGGGAGVRIHEELRGVPMEEKIRAEYQKSEGKQQSENEGRTIKKNDRKLMEKKSL